MFDCGGAAATARLFELGEVRELVFWYGACWDCGCAEADCCCRPSGMFWELPGVLYVDCPSDTGLSTP